jgi:hypothetical protein
MYRGPRYWTRCYYCRKLVKGGRQGIRGHLRGCPFIRRVQTYTFIKAQYLVDAGPSTLHYFDVIFKRFHSTLEDEEAFLFLLDDFNRKRNKQLRYSFQVVPIEPAKS